jgi:hypothetical protein
VRGIPWDGASEDMGRRRELRLSLIGVCLTALVACEDGTGEFPPASATSPSPPASAFEPVSLAVTFTADPACSMLPQATRSRTYLATTSLSPLLTLRGASFAAPTGPWNVISQRTAGDSVEWSFQDPPIWEQLGSQEDLVIYGGPVRLVLEAGTTAPQPTAVPFWGRFSYCPDRGQGGGPDCAEPWIVCTSDRHVLSVGRQ